MTTKHKLSEPLLSEIHDYAALNSVWSALEGDPGPLVIRLRDGKATPVERRVAADLIEDLIKGVKPKRPRRRSSRGEQLKIAESVAFFRKMYPKAPKKISVCAAREEFKEAGREPSERYVHKVLKKFDDKVLAEFKRMYRNSTDDDREHVLGPERKKRVRDFLQGALMISSWRRSNTCLHEYIFTNASLDRRLAFVEGSCTRLSSFVQAFGSDEPLSKALHLRTSADVVIRRHRWPISIRE
jgi:hypothetical protein